MQLVADLHIHSHYSRATSKDLTFEYLARWAQIKGVNIVGTGDISHPGWLREMHAKLEPAEEGLFRLKPEYAAAVQAQVPAAAQGTVRFLLAGEISNIYKRHGAVRKVHNVIFAPTLEAVQRIQIALEKIGNIRADGRPILGLDSRDLLEIILEIDPNCYLIPAHIWTPWFSMLGSKSGFDSVEECFGDLTSYIFAMETGLSSDPPMNWRVSNLERYTLVSNSDAHSPQKLAREATLFSTDLTYAALFHALHTGDPDHFSGTVEFFPEEGKYHLDGHRKCGICWEPPTTLAHHGVCPVCGREITVGVMHRVEVLADRPVGYRPPRPHPFYNLIPLPEVLGEVHGAGPSSRRVQQEYEKLLARVGPELFILREAPLAEIASAGGSRLAEGIQRMRSGQVTAEAGYDGEYGVIKLFAGPTREAGTPQIDLFGNDLSVSPARAIREPGASRPAGEPAARAASLSPQAPMPPDAPGAFAKVQNTLFADAPGELTQSEVWLARLNPEQRAAALHTSGPLVIVAGPGTGKTRTLTVRIAHLLGSRQAAAENILAITFTNKAAGEMADRLNDLVGIELAQQVTVRTFHALGALLLRKYGEQIGLPTNFAIAGEQDRRDILERALPTLRDADLERCLIQISAAKNQLLAPQAPELVVEPWGDTKLPAVYALYETTLRAAQMLDFDDLILQTVQLFEQQPAVLAAVQARYRWISVDEYQDVNLAQYRFLRLLTAGGANLCVIGDPDQAIYGFRGADRRYFLAFAQDFPGATLRRLTRNYRSPQSLLDAATQVIARGQDREAVELWSDFSEQVKIEIQPAPTDKAEAEYVVHQIEQQVGGTSYFSLDSGRVDDRGRTTHRAFSDFAVLFRLGAQSRLLVEAFERSGIPYQLVGQASPYAAKPVRELLAMLWLLVNPQSTLHLEIVLSAGRAAASRRFVEQVLSLAAAHQNGLGEAFAHGVALPNLTAAQRAKLGALAAGWHALQVSREGAPVTQLVEQSNALLAALRGDESQRAAPDWLVALLLRAASYNGRLEAFLEATALAGASDGHDPRADRVTLMTLHAAKGLEFPVVFIAGCEEGLMPYLPEKRRADLDEERRLFYVGMTRAQQRLILTHARTRFLFGQRIRPIPSRFVDDIEQVLKEVHEAEQRRGKADRDEGEQLSLF